MKGLICVLGILVFAAPAFSADHEVHTLKGLKGLYVNVASIREEVVKDGLTPEMIQIDTELKLRLAGIRVHSREESLKERASSYLYIIPNIVKSPCGGYVVGLDVELKQYVCLVRSPTVHTFAATWSRGSCGITSLRDIRNSIKDLVDEFINAYLSVNPKQ